MTQITGDAIAAIDGLNKRIQAFIFLQDMEIRVRLTLVVIVCRPNEQRMC